MAKYNNYLQHLEEMRYGDKYKTYLPRLKNDRPDVNTLLLQRLTDTDLEKHRKIITTIAAQYPYLTEDSYYTGCIVSYIIGIEDDDIMTLCRQVTYRELVYIMLIVYQLYGAERMIYIVKRLVRQKYGKYYGNIDNINYNNYTRFTNIAHDILKKDNYKTMKSFNTELEAIMEKVPDDVIQQLQTPIQYISSHTDDKIDIALHRVTGTFLYNFERAFLGDTSGSFDDFMGQYRLTFLNVHNNLSDVLLLDMQDIIVILQQQYEINDDIYTTKTDKHKSSSNDNQWFASDYFQRQELEAMKECGPSICLNTENPKKCQTRLDKRIKRKQDFISMYQGGNIPHETNIVNNIAITLGYLNGEFDSCYLNDSIDCANLSNVISTYYNEAENLLPTLTEGMKDSYAAVGQDIKQFVMHNNELKYMACNPNNPVYMNKVANNQKIIDRLFAVDFENPEIAEILDNNMEYKQLLESSPQEQVNFLRKILIKKLSPSLFQKLSIDSTIRDTINLLYPIINTEDYEQVYVPTNVKQWI